MKFCTKIDNEYKHIEQFINSIPNIFEQQGTLVYDGRRNTIKSFKVNDSLTINVKRYHKPSYFNKIIYSFNIRKPKGLRAFTYPYILKKKKIETPQSVAYIEQRNVFNLLEYSYYVYVNCNYTNTLYEMGWERMPEVGEKAHALALFTAHIHNQKVLHKDYSPGNILYKKDSKGYHFAIIDINRMNFKEVDLKTGCANFARLWGNKETFIYIAKQYAKARHFDEEQCVKWVLFYRNKFWKKYGKKHNIAFSLD